MATTWSIGGSGSTSWTTEAGTGLSSSIAGSVGSTRKNYSFFDDQSLIFGNGQDFQLLYDSTDARLEFNDVSGTTLMSLSASVNMFGNLTVGADGSGHDVKFFGDTPGKYMLWDESANKLIVQGAFQVTTGVANFQELNVDGDATFSGNSVYLKDASYDSGTPVKALSLNTSDGAIKIAGVEMKTTGVMKFKTLTQVEQEALTPAIGDMVMRSDGLTAKTEPYLYSD